MLILSRNPQEWILLRVPGLEKPIEIQIVRVCESQVRLGFNAPTEVKIWRKEVDQIVNPLEYQKR